MNDIEPIVPSTTDTTDTNPTPTEGDVDKVVITVPAKLRRAVVATVEFVRSIFTGEIILNASISKG